MNKVDDVAAAFLDDLGSMSTMKLQKLCYYAQAWSLATYNEPLFEETLEAWGNGPVVRALWEQRRGRKTVSAWPSGAASHLDPAARRFVASIAKQYGHLSGDALSILSHQEAPWAVARGSLPESARSSRPIPHEVMARYYRRQMLTPAEAIDHAVANAELEGIAVDPEFACTLSAVSRGEESIDDAISATIRRFARV